MEYKRLYENDELKSKHPVGSYLPDYLSSKMQYENDRGYGSSPRNGVEDRIQRIAETIGRLLATLNAKNFLTDNEILNIVGLDDHEIKRDNITLVMEKRDD